MVYLPHIPAPRGDYPDTLAYHASFSYKGQQVAYVVSWGHNTQLLAWDASHEYAESATDPYYLSNGNGSGWYGKNDYNFEICDITNDFAWFDGYKMAQFVTPPGFVLPTSPSPPAPPSNPGSPPAAQPGSPFAGLANFYEVIIQDFETMLRQILGTIETDLARLHI